MMEAEIERIKYQRKRAALVLGVLNEGMKEQHGINKSQTKARIKEIQMAVNAFFPALRQSAIRRALQNAQCYMETQSFITATGIIAQNDIDNWTAILNHMEQKKLPFIRW